jgi:hypothetical protein
MKRHPGVLKRKIKCAVANGRGMRKVEWVWGWRETRRRKKASRMSEKRRKDERS